MSKHKLYLGLLVFLAFVASAQSQHSDHSPVFTFGVIADVQYADVDQSGKRDYRGSLRRLEKSIEIFNQNDLSFIVHAGDLIDRDFASFDTCLNIFKKSRAPVHYVMGNHEFSIEEHLKKKVRPMLNNPKGYFSFVVANIQFIILDAMDISAHASPKDSKQYKTALLIQERLKTVGANNTYDWNGAIGKRQLRWLKQSLAQATRENLKTVLFSHLPLLPENGLQLWNNEQVLSILDQSPSVIAFISGHHHSGGYIRKGRIHHLTLKGLVESTPDTACGIVEVFPDGLSLRGFGDQPDQLLLFK